MTNHDALSLVKAASLVGFSGDVTSFGLGSRGLDVSDVRRMLRDALDATVVGEHRANVFASLDGVDHVIHVAIYDDGSLLVEGLE